MAVGLDHLPVARIEVFTAEVDADAQGPDRFTAGPADGMLVRLAAGGDERAWEMIVARHGPYLSGIGRNHRLRHEEFSDALQEAWSSAVAHLTELRDPSRLRPWLATIMRRSCGRVIRQRRRDRAHLVSDVADLIGGRLGDEQVDVEREILSAERTTMLRRALSQLPDRERALIHQIVLDDLSYAEIARRLAMPVGSIGPTRMRALRRLRVILQQTQDIDVSQAA